MPALPRVCISKTSSPPRRGGARGGEKNQLIKIGCTGFPVGQKFYQSKFRVVEMNQFMKKAPRVTTVDRWKKTAPSDFEFVLSTVALNRRLFDQAYQAAHTLGSKIILIETPPKATPSVDMIGKLQTFFKSLPRNNLSLAWEAPPKWPESLVESLLKSLHLIPASNPLQKENKFRTPVRYFRVGRDRPFSPHHSLSDQELAVLRNACVQGHSYVLFNNGPYAFKDALRFASYTGNLLP